MGLQRKQMLQLPFGSRENAPSNRTTPLIGLQEQFQFHFDSRFNHFLCVEKLLSIPKLACEASLLTLEVKTNSFNWTRLNIKNYTSVKQLIILFMKCSLFQDNCLESSVKAILNFPDEWWIKASHDAGHSRKVIPELFLLSHLRGVDLSWCFTVAEIRQHFFGKTGISWH